MMSRRDDRGLFSRLPDDDAYWEALTDRVVADAAERLRVYRAGERPWWHRLSRMSTPLTLAAAASVAAALLWLPWGGGEEPTRGYAADIFGLGPTDVLAERLLGATAPPAVATLIDTRTSEVQR